MSAGPPNAPPSVLRSLLSDVGSQAPIFENPYPEEKCVLSSSSACIGRRQEMKAGFAPMLDGTAAEETAGSLKCAVHRAFHLVGLEVSDLDETAAVAFRTSIAEYLASSPSATDKDPAKRAAAVAIATGQSIDNVPTDDSHRRDVTVDHVYITGAAASAGSRDETPAGMGGVSQYLSSSKREGGDGARTLGSTAAAAAAAADVPSISLRETGTNVTFAVLARDEREAHALHRQLCCISTDPLPFCRLLRANGILKGDRTSKTGGPQNNYVGAGFESGNAPLGRSCGPNKGKGTGKGKGKGKGRGKKKGRRKRGNGTAGGGGGGSGVGAAADEDGASKFIEGGLSHPVAPISRKNDTQSHWFEATGQMQVELMARKEKLLQKAQQNAVTLKDISDHQVHISGLIADMEKSKEEITRKYRITEAMLKQAGGRGDAKRMGTISERMERLRQRERIFNENVSFLNREVAWFHDSPAFKKAQKYVQQNWVQCGAAGPWVHKDDLVEDEVDFSSMLEQMKMEDKAEAEARAHDSDAASAAGSLLSSPSRAKESDV